MQNRASAGFSRLQLSHSIRPLYSAAPYTRKLLIFHRFQATSWIRFAQRSPYTWAVR